MRAKRTILELLDGQKTFGRLTVIGESEPIPLPNGKERRRALCLCSCPLNKTVAVPLQRLRNGRTASCGCKKTEFIESLRGRPVKNAIRSQDLGTPELSVWRGTIGRCHSKNNSSYPDYGGRGIRVCPQWRESFPQFLNDLGPRPHPKWSLDRINVNGNYEPGNVRWTDAKTQARNTRRAAKIILDGKETLVSEACERLGINGRAIDTISYRTGLSKAEVLNDYISGRRKVRGRRKTA